MLNNENTAIPTKTYWSGEKRIIADAFWCLLLVTALLAIEKTNLIDPAEKVGYFFGRFIACFFIFFFWSWKREQVKYYWPRLIIHTLFWCWFFLSGTIMCTIIYFLPQYLSNYTAWCYLLLQTIVAIFTAVKYSRLMCPENPKYYILNSIKNAFFYVIHCIKNLVMLALKKFRVAKPSVRYSIIAALGYTILYPLLNSWLGIWNGGITTIPFLILVSLLNKTLWLYIFLFWCGWNLFSILRSLNNTWAASLSKTNRCNHELRTEK